MIEGLEGLVPPSLAEMTAKMVVGTPASRPLPWRDPQAFEDVLTRFAAPYPHPDRPALVSLWSQYYLAALIIPATVMLLRRDQALPVMAGDIGIEIDEAGTIGRFVVRDGGRPSDHGSRFRALVEGHVEPFAEACLTYCGLPTRVLRSNAATIFDYAMTEVLRSPPVVEAAYGEANSLLNGPPSPWSRLYRRDEGCAWRRVCCLRYRLAGVPRCAGICPLDRPPRARRSLR